MSSRHDPSVTPKRGRTLTKPGKKHTVTSINSEPSPPPGVERVVIPDAVEPGLSLRVYRSGKKVWSLYYRTVEGRQRRLKLGAAPTMHPDRARALARQRKGEAAAGGDPAAERRAARAARSADISLGKALDRYLEWGEKNKKPSTLCKDRQYAALIKRALRGKRLGDLDETDVRRLRDTLSATPIKANRTLALLSHLCTMAEVWGLRPKGSNPCRGVERYQEHRRHRPLTELEARRLGKALDELAPRFRVAVEAIRFMMLVGCRPSEALGVTWPEVDLDEGIVRLRDSKTGRRTLYLGPAAVAVLQRQPKEPDNLHVFPGAKPGRPLSSVRRAWAEARRLARLEGDDQPRLYDATRHSFGDAAVEVGVGDNVLGALLGHASTTTTRVYRDVRAAPARRAVAAIEGPLAERLGIAPPKEAQARKDVS